MLFARLLESAAVLYTRLTEDAHMDCYFDEARPSHEENVYMPEKARGGTQLCLVSVRQPVRITELMPAVDGQWNLATLPSNLKLISSLQGLLCFSLRMYSLNKYCEDVFFPRMSAPVLRTVVPTR